MVIAKHGTYSAKAMDEIVEKGVRVQALLPPDWGTKLRDLAKAEHRPIRFQAELLIIEALKAREAREASLAVGAASNN
jgi:hypothetical protein